MKTHTFVISLERSADRFAHAATLLPKLPLSGEVLPAVDGSQLSDAEIAEFYQPGVHQPIYPFQIGLGEIGCFLSHRNAWQAIVDRDLDAALILEDDVAIDEDRLRRAVEFVADRSPRGAYVQLPVRVLPSNVQRVVAYQGCQLVRPRVTPLRTSGQWVSRAAAEKLLAVTRTIDRPVDTTLQMHWLTGVPMLAVEPSGISDMTAELGGSTISISKKNAFGLSNVSREVNRTWYRWRIARLSARAEAA